MMVVPAVPVRSKSTVEFVAPLIRDSFNKVAKRVPAFKGILNEWDSLVALLKSEMKIHGNKAPETYRRISELRKD
ncbi:hypothetical protein DZ11F43_21190 [Escherichia coli]|nr:hypothetical protein [Escherichia coli]